MTRLLHEIRERIALVIMILALIALFIIQQIQHANIDANQDTRDFAACQRVQHIRTQQNLVSYTTWIDVETNDPAKRRFLNEFLSWTPLVDCEAVEDNPVKYSAPASILFSSGHLPPPSALGLTESQMKNVK